MQRYAGQRLGPHPHVAVLFYDSVGDFVVVTPLLRGLREAYPDIVLDYFGGERTRQFEAASRLIDARFSLYGTPDGLEGLWPFVQQRREDAGPYALAINCDFHDVNALATSLLRPRYVVGRAYGLDQRAELPAGRDKVDELLSDIWFDEGFADRYRGTLSSTFIGEIFCRLAHVETDYQATEVPWEKPPVAVPRLLISTGATRSAKMWPRQHWKEVIDWCTSKGIDVGLLGDRPASQRQHYHSADDEEYLVTSTALVDLRGAFTLPQVAGAMRETTACLTIDNGLMHVAIASGVPTIALFGASPWRLWVPRGKPHVHLLLTERPCPLCAENRFQNKACLRDDWHCMAFIRPQTAIVHLQEILAV